MSELRKALRERGARIIAKHWERHDAVARDELAYGIADLVESLSPQEAKPGEPSESALGLLEAWLKESQAVGFATDSPMYVAGLRARTARWVERARGKALP